ncbi:MAG: ethidium bromide-methyl viologen resistance protein emrE [Frankiales bacterium]|nr:ethidium bromide-methyl viologen resistance protein emrE [Frankiales bacterium]
MAVGLLLGAIFVEVLATTLLAQSDGFTKLVPTLVCLAGYALSFTLFAKAVRELPVGLSYALWSGLGTVSILVIGVLFLDEHVNAVQVGGVVLVLAGVAVIHLGDGLKPKAEQASAAAVVVAADRS